MNYLLQLWAAIDGAAKANKAPLLIYQESSLVIRAIRDYYTADIGEILIDTEDVYEQAKGFMGHVMPNTVSRVKLYQDDVPLFCFKSSTKSRARLAARSTCRLAARS